ncbi:hypothetical protein ACJ41O_008143 [Fusarium nematophilum]
MQSPVSETGIPRPSLGDLSRYSRGSDRLSNLRSSSSSGGEAAVRTESSHEVTAEAAAAVTGLRRQPISSYRRFELVSSTEDLPSYETAIRNGNDKDQSQSSSNRTLVTRESGHVSIAEIKNRHDVVAEQSHSKSPSPSVLPPQTCPRGIKRSASGISFRSLTKGVKRSRLDVKRLALSAYRTSSRKFSQARESVKRRHKDRKKQYSAWKAMRRRLRPGDAIKGKPEKGFTAFAIERSRHGHDAWWRAGVDKYRAPLWVQFDE